MSAEDTKIVPLRASAALASEDAFVEDLKRWRGLIKSGALPAHIKTPEQAITIARMGEVYGWDPIRALRSIYVVDGRPEMSAESMLALVREKCPEAVIVPTEMSAQRVAISVQRPPMPSPVIVSVDIAQFRHLAKKSNWANYPEDMLWARCVSRVGRRFFSDVTAGAYTTGELSEAQFTVRQVGPREAEPIDDQRPEVEPEDVSQEPEFDDYEEPPEDWKPEEAP